MRVDPVTFDDLAMQHPAYWAEIKLHWNALVMLPYLYKRMAAAKARGGVVMFTWFRWDGVPEGPPDVGIWSSHEGRLWLADVVATPGMSGFSVGKTLRNALVDLGIAREGERVYLQRMHSQRYGCLVARGGRANVRTVQVGEQGNLSHV